MTEQTTIEALKAYAGDLSEAAAIASAASAKQSEYVNGSEHAEVIVESGRVPTLARQALLAKEQVGEVVSGVAAQMAGATTYATVALGLQKVPFDGFFSVPSPNASEYLILYQNKNGAAVEMKRYPAAQALVDVRAETDKLAEAVSLTQDVVTDRYSEDLVFSVVDADSRRTWLEANKKDGGPSEWSETILRRMLGLNRETRTGYLLALTDAAGRMTDLSIRESDGQVPDWVINRWAARLAPIFGTSANAGIVFANDTYLRDGEVLPMLANMKQITGWGSSTIDEWASDLAALATSFGATYYNGGNGATEMQHTMAQMGVTPAKLLPVGGSIPASGAIQVACSNVAPNAYWDATTGTLAGVAGVLTSDGKVWTFTRSASGVAVAVPVEQPFKPTQGLAHRADFTLLNACKNDVNNGYSLDDIYAKHTKAFDWLSPFVKRVIVITHFGSSGNTDPAHTARIKALNEYIFSRYGSLVFDLGGYLASPQVWTDTGFTPTADDLANQANGCMPATLSRDNWAHMNATTRAAAANKLKSFITSLKWY